MGKHNGQRSEASGSTRLHGERKKKENEGCKVANVDESTVLARRQWGRGRRTRKATRAVWLKVSKQPTTLSSDLIYPNTCHVGARTRLSAFFLVSFALYCSQEPHFVSI